MNIYMNTNELKELILGLVLWIFGWTLFEKFLIIYKFKVTTKFYICLVGFMITLCLFYREIKDDNDSNE
jgi:hypothetical protein